MRRVLLVVDVQNDFVTGSLGTREAQAVVGKIIEKVYTFNGDVIFTRDSHDGKYFSFQEGRNLPVEHCIVNTFGHELIDELKHFASLNNSLIIDKHSFGSVDCAYWLKHLFDNGEFKTLEVIGLDSDICVISNCLFIKSLAPEIKIVVDSSCCAGTSAENHEPAMMVLKSCQIEVI